METTTSLHDERYRPTTISRVLGGLFMLVGVLRLADWLYSGRTETRDLVAGIGFVLMSPAAWTGANAADAPARLRRLRLLSVPGIVLVFAAIVMRFF
ncbi:hypothetical protein [Lysobacter xanthus]